MNDLISNLIRILRRETADHPLIAVAIEAKADLIEGLNWNNPDRIAQASAKLADGIEDWVGYRGESLGHYVREPWLSVWRGTCHRALIEAHADTLNLIR